MDLEIDYYLTMSGSFGPGTDSTLWKNLIKRSMAALKFHHSVTLMIINQFARIKATCYGDFTGALEYYRVVFGGEVVGFWKRSQADAADADEFVRFVFEARRPARRRRWRITRRL